MRTGLALKNSGEQLGDGIDGFRVERVAAGSAEQAVSGPGTLAASAEPSVGCGSALPS